MRESVIALILLTTSTVVTAFVPSHSLFAYNAAVKSSSCVVRVTQDTDVLAEIGFGVSVAKPLGVIFGENGEPYKGLVVDDVEPGLNGGTAGLRVGDQLLAVNGEATVGLDFDSVMDRLLAAEGTMELLVFRGPVRSLYTILNNKGAKETDDDNDDNDDDDDGQQVIMDENYESPVKVNLEDYEEKPITPADVVNAFKNLGSMLTSELKEASTPPPPKEEKKKSGGFLGGLFAQETIQLEGDDASSGSK